MSWHAVILTLFPDMFPGPLGHSLAGKALARGDWALDVTDIRSFATHKHSTVHDNPFGGGAGMVLRADVLDRPLAAKAASLDRFEVASLRPSHCSKQMSHRGAVSPAAGLVEKTPPNHSNCPASNVRTDGCGIWHIAAVHLGTLARYFPHTRSCPWPCDKNSRADSKACFPKR